MSFHNIHDMIERADEHSILNDPEPVPHIEGGTCDVTALLKKF